MDLSLTACQLVEFGQVGLEGRGWSIPLETVLTSWSFLDKSRLSNLTNCIYLNCTLMALLPASTSICVINLTFLFSFGSGIASLQWRMCGLHRAPCVVTVSPIYTDFKYQQEAVAQSGFASFAAWLPPQIPNWLQLLRVF